MQSLRRFVREIFQTATFRQSLVTFSGTAINGALGALFYILAARALGPANFGLMVVAITALTLFADIAELGVATSTVRFVGQHLEQRKEKAYRFLKLGLEIKLIALVIFTTVGWFLAPFIAQVIFKKNELIFPLKLAFIGVGGYMLLTFSTTAFQSLQKFYHWSGVQIGSNLLRLLIIVFLWQMGSLDLNSALSTYIAIPFLAFAASLFFLPREFLKVTKELQELNQFFHYSKWVALFTLLAAISARLDIFLTARLLPADQVGYYGAANQLVAVVPQIVVALHTVIAPKMAAMGTIRDLVSYIKKTQILVLGLAGLGVVFSPVVLILIPLLYGPSYAPFVPPIFLVLFIAMMIFLISVPIHMSVFYYFSYPQLFVWLSAGHMLIIGFLGWWMISMYGAIGAAITVLVGMIFNLIVPLVWVVNKVSDVRGGK